MGARRTRGPRGPVVFDSDVLIWYLRGDARARAAFEGVPHSSRLIPAIARMEVLRGSRDRSELRLVRRFLDSAFSRTVEITEEISRRAGMLIERYVLSHGLAPDDAIIAATALTLGVPLFSANVSDYRFITGLELLPFRP